jgi:hypothetical protein
MVVAGVANLFERWKEIYSNSVAVSTTITTTHLFALLVGGGLAIGGDRSTLRSLREDRAAWEREYQLRELCYLHRPILIALFVIMTTGLALAAADVEVYAVSGVFWAKMALIVMLVLNGFTLARTERKLAAVLKAKESPPDRLWNRLRRATWTSLSLWLLTAAAGALLTAAG